MFFKCDYIGDAIDYIEKHLFEQLDLDKVAKEIHYSKYHLHRTFRTQVGFPLHGYIQRRRLSEAAKLLVFSKRPILEIAMLAGYESQQAFSSIFKAMYKKTPYQYRKELEYYPLQLAFKMEISKESRVIMDWKKNIHIAEETDVEDWMELVQLAIDGFPCLEEVSYRKQLVACIKEKKAYFLKMDGLMIAAMQFDKEVGSIDFFGIHPRYREVEIANAFLEKVMEEIEIGKEISTTTFRDGDKADTGHRKLLKKLGFVERELLIEFGYPTQKFILQQGVHHD